MSKTMIDYAMTIYNALDRATSPRPYTAVRMHPETATAVKLAAHPYDYYTFTTLPSLMGMTLIVDDSVEPGQFRFEYEVATMLRKEIDDE